jgi:hypothetical protein
VEAVVVEVVEVEVVVVEVEVVEDSLQYLYQQMLLKLQVHALFLDLYQDMIFLDNLQLYNLKY